MPKTAKPNKKQGKTMEAALWESCNKLRGVVEPAEYKHVVLSLIFLKYAGDRFEQHQRLEGGLHHGQSNRQVLANFAKICKN
jgi:hypothetical protein